MKDWAKKFWINIAGGVILIIVTVVVNSYMTQKAVANNKVQNAASTTFVDEKFKEAITHSDKNDEKIITDLNKKMDSFVPKTSFDLVVNDITFIKNYIINNKK